MTRHTPCPEKIGRLLCRNGGQCYPVFGRDRYSYLCVCPPNFHGTHCEWLFYPDVYGFNASEIEASDIALIFVLAITLVVLVVVCIVYCMTRDADEQGIVVATADERTYPPGDVKRGVCARLFTGKMPDSKCKFMQRWNGARTLMTRLFRKCSNKDMRISGDYHPDPTSHGAVSPPRHNVDQTISNTERKPTSQPLFATPSVSGEYSSVTLVPKTPTMTAHIEAKKWILNKTVESNSMHLFV